MRDAFPCSLLELTSEMHRKERVFCELSVPDVSFSMVSLLFVIVIFLKG